MGAQVPAEQTGVRVPAGSEHRHTQRRGKACLRLLHGRLPLARLQEAWKVLGRCANGKTSSSGSTTSSGEHPLQMSSVLARHPPPPPRNPAGRLCRAQSRLRLPMEADSSLFQPAQCSQQPLPAHRRGHRRPVKRLLPCLHQASGGSQSRGTAVLPARTARLALPLPGCRASSSAHTRPLGPCTRTGGVAWASPPHQSMLAVSRTADRSDCPACQGEGCGQHQSLGERGPAHTGCCLYA